MDIEEVGAREEEKVEEEPKEEEEGQKDLRIRPNEMSSDAEYEFFDMSGSRGNSLNIRAGYARYSADAKTSFGGNYYFNRLTFKGGDGFTNNFVNLFTKTSIYSGAKSSIKMGINFDYMAFDTQISDNAGYGVGGLLGGTHYTSGNSLFSWGGIYQYVSVEKLKAQYLSGGLMYGLPVAHNFTFIIDALGTYALNLSYDGNNIEVEDPFLLILGGYLGVYVSSAFSLNIGVKTFLLIEDYSSYELCIGAGYRF